MKKLLAAIAVRGTYLDEDVARLILSGQFPPEGIEVTVSKPGLTTRARTRTGEAGAR